MEEFTKAIDASSKKWIDTLAETVAIKSVSADPVCRPECIRMMEWAKTEILRLGGYADLHPIGDQTMPGGQVVPLPPILLGGFGKDPKKKTVCVYGHLDVQPAEKEDGWDTDPWNLTEVDGKLYGRGSTDDKAPVLAWLWVVEVYQQLGRELPVNVKICLEGMEESGSEGLDEFLFKNTEWFKDVDFTCISDNYWLGPRKPCVTYGLRGMAYFVVTVKCAKKDLHSGVFGGSVHEAMHDMCKLLASLNKDDGSIAVPGVMDTVRPFPAEEQKLYESIDFDPEEFRTECGAPNALRFPDKKGVLSHWWRFPSLSVHGIEGAWSGAGGKTVIPKEVKGKFSIRLVPDQKPEEQEKHVKAHLESVFKNLKSPNTMTVEMINGAPAWLSDPSDPNYMAARRAIEKVFGVAPDLTREGGSIPVTNTFQEVTKKSVMLLPIGGSDDGAHSQNEKINRENYINGAKVLGMYLEEIAAAGSA
uniref:Peptidase M20 dimerisation domain-containing protein n=1 Tax=Chromera velia CCMP2878 TaxID=1169474 RepID=A0A0G4HED4_9ALVE|mmetsp:Transcript_3124/g.6446  ORF Transcript_3124/g.6446 Transcript_3124/m.6446 type:complete len:474 (+) Transcript_3124:166-1587(+)|eukprot:Cvel_26737.t1-p1 / transcript=Cvel_26737.t1 / gene=Cvel_26737 / organism=Chromera_velia_CCMP2878 / gene_product=Cytosolic non-specific dipeptidase, putative / transcript_product=Cytosolic non-specific dipeptidase, putative / location=Cvel_scaffold3227:13482-17153(-) / protein_length=473 / sequence_SO=supercontig / SO=protein_coding / is_pseudo=false